MPRRDSSTRHRAVTRFGARVLVAESFAEIAREMERTDSEPEGVGIMTRKARTVLIRLEQVPLKASPLLKQEMLALGADAAHARGVADLSVEHTPVVLIATPGQYQRLVPKLRRQPFKLREIADAIEAVLGHYTSQAPRTVPGLHRSVTVGDRTRVMGILNLTPDSFYDGGRYEDSELAFHRAIEMEREGADLIDVGAESSRPGAIPVPAAEEIARLRRVLPRLHAALEVPIAIDTQKAEVARAALEMGADLVNDVSGLRDPEMRKLIVRTGAPVIVVHMRGTPATMQQELEYADLRGEVYRALAERTSQALDEGAQPAQLLVDPGLGFGKSPEQNLELLNHLSEFRSLGYPVVVGPSRKSFLGRALGGAPVEARAEASLAAAVVAALKGAHIVRVHDVGSTVKALAVADAVRRERFLATDAAA